MPSRLACERRMEPPRTQNDSLTPSQRQAVAARGNVLMERCLAGSPQFYRRRIRP
ncbi:MAG TPA: hypothetical protein VFC17_04200 [Candidatus Limnocylindrales bacterium]|nr:hypothetical protein [Candidatus Limnocylindrales bacterium]